MNLISAVKLSLQAFIDIEKAQSIGYAHGRAKPMIDTLIDALGDAAMQDQQMMERGTKAWPDVSASARE